MRPAQSLAAAKDLLQAKLFDRRAGEAPAGSDFIETGPCGVSGPTERESIGIAETNTTLRTCDKTLLFAA